MEIINDIDIKLYRGDTSAFAVETNDFCDLSNATAIFEIKDNAYADKIILKKEASYIDYYEKEKCYVIGFDLIHNDTIDIAPSNYEYDIRIIADDFDVYSPVKFGKFILMKEINEIGKLPIIEPPEAKAHIKPSGNPIGCEPNICSPSFQFCLIPKGKDGFSPVAKVENIDGDIKITITDKSGTTEAIVPKTDITKILDDRNVSDKTTYSSKMIEDILKSPQYSNLVVTTVRSPLGTFSADYNSQEIRNWVNAGGTVEMRFDDVIENSGEQVYDYLKFKDNYAWFRRPVKEGKKIRQIDIKVDYKGTVTFEVDESIFATDEKLKTVETTSNNALTLAQEVDQDKLGRKTYAIASDKLTQFEVADIISDYANYEGNIIEFLTNGDMPNKVVGYGFLMTDKNGNQFLNVLNLDGTIIQWNKTSFEKHTVESYNYINEIVDIDNLTIDVEGNPPFYSTVQKAFNKPSGTSDFGMIEVKAYNKGMQIQKYTDMQNGKEFIRTVNGQPDRHAFGVWTQSNTIA